VQERSTRAPHVLTKEEERKQRCGKYPYIKLHTQRCAPTDSRPSGNEQEIAESQRSSAIGSRQLSPRGISSGKASRLWPHSNKTIETTDSPSQALREYVQWTRRYIEHADPIQPFFDALQKDDSAKYYHFERRW
jgi:hypothetical protein